MQPALSFEFFPPRNLNGSFRLWDTMRALAPFGPDFVSVTYGAGGTTRELTHEAVRTLGARFGVPVAAHLTCIGATRQETLAIAESYAAAGVNQIVALRGDAPGDGAPFTASGDGFANSCELIRALADTGRFHIRVSAYPDRHPEAKSDNADIEWLKRKVDAGANSAITQFFFDAATFLRFRDRAAAAGINTPIIPGILPIENWSRTLGFAQRCGASVPTWLARAFMIAERDGRADDLAIATASELCTRLREGGVDHLHFYTLNKPALTSRVLEAQGYQTQSIARVA